MTPLRIGGVTIDDSAVDLKIGADLVGGMKVGADVVYQWQPAETLLVSFDITPEIIFGQGGWRGWVSARGWGVLHDLAADPSYAGPGTGTAVTVNAVMWLGGNSIRLSVTAGTVAGNFPARIEISRGDTTLRFSSPDAPNAAGLGAQVNYDLETGAVGAFFTQGRCTVSLYG